VILILKLIGMQSPVFNGTILVVVACMHSNDKAKH
jgi:hypothetical protein